MNWDDRAGYVVVVGVAVDYVAAEVLYLWWFLWGRLISDEAAEIVMVVECWCSDVMYFYIVSTSKKIKYHTSGLYLNSPPILHTLCELNFLDVPLVVSVVTKVVSVIKKGR